MSRDLVCAEGELSIVLHKTERYMEFLDECICEYNEILDNLSENGIEDVKICMQLKLLTIQLDGIKRQLSEVYPEIAQCVQREIRDIEASDDFTYPDLSFGNLMSTLAAFL